jgi:hypothetical protein
MPFSRREFVGILGAATALRGASVRADLILYNGNIHTMDPANPEADAVAISGGRFLAAGTKDEINNLASASTKRIDLGGHTVLPGFIDAHLHTASSGLRHLKEVDCDLRSIAAIQAAIRERAAKTPPGQWVVGFKYDDTKTSDGRPLTIADLDAAAPNNPVLVNHRGGHTSWVNSKALAVADVNEKTPDPPGGKFERGPDGKLTGRVMESATEPFDSKIPNTATRAERQEGVKLITKMIVRSGITSVNDGPARRSDCVSGRLRGWRPQRESLRVHQPAVHQADAAFRSPYRIGKRMGAGGRHEDVLRWIDLRARCAGFPALRRAPKRLRHPGQ